MLSTTQKIVHEIFSTFTGEKNSNRNKKDRFITDIAMPEINKIMKAQQKNRICDYEKAGFVANTITAKTVQQQIISSYEKVS